MNFSISKNKFYDSLQDVSHAISSTTPLPALKGIKMQVTQDNVMVLTASDNDITIQKTLSNESDEDLNLQVNEEGSIVIESKYLLDIVHKIDSDIVKIELIDGAFTMFKGNNAEFRINGMKASEYPTIDLSKPVDEMTLPVKTLIEIIEQTSFATSTSEQRAILTGVNFSLKQNKLQCCGTDSYRLARKIIDFESDKEVDFTIPAKSLAQVKSILLLDETASITMNYNEKKCQFTANGIVLQTRLLEGNFPEADRLISPLVFNRTLTVDRSLLISVIDRGMFIKNDNMSINRLQCSEDEILISNKSQEIGDFKQNLSLDGATYEGEPLDISFSSIYVLQAARALKGNTICIKFAGEMKPFILTNPDDDSILQLSLPIRTYN